MLHERDYVAGWWRIYGELNRESLALSGSVCFVTRPFYPSSMQPAASTKKGTADIAYIYIRGGCKLHLLDSLALTVLAMDTTGT